MRSLESLLTLPPFGLVGESFSPNLSGEKAEGGEDGLFTTEMMLLTSIFTTAIAFLSVDVVKKEAGGLAAEMAATAAPNLEGVEENGPIEAIPPEGLAEEVQV